MYTWQICTSAESGATNLSTLQSLQTGGQLYTMLVMVKQCPQMQKFSSNKYDHKVPTEMDYYVPDSHCCAICYIS